MCCAAPVAAWCDVDNFDSDGLLTAGEWLAPGESALTRCQVTTGNAGPRIRLVGRVPGSKPENMARLQWTGIVRVGMDCGVWGSLAFAGEGAQEVSKYLRRPLRNPVLW